MKREDLKALGLSDEQVNAVMQQNGMDVENAKKNAGTDAAAAEKLRADGLQAQLDTLTADLTQARASAATARELRNALDAANAKIAASQKAGTIRDALAAYKPRDAAMLMRLLDLDRITIDEKGEIAGLKEQVDPLKAASGYLFSDTPDENGGTPPASGGKDTFDMNAFLRG